MSHLFISHSTKDREKLQPFLDLLAIGMGINQDEIFCTLQKGTLATGENFMDKIKLELGDCKKVICFITPNYLKSISCLVELGAAWYQSGKVIPIIVKPLKFSDLNNTPLSGLQALSLDNSDDLFQLYDELCNYGIAKSGQASLLNNRISKFVNLIENSNIIFHDKDGYYTARIEQIRNTPPAYKCYKIEGILNLDEEFSQDETHWIFYKSGMYPDLSVGNTIKFSIDSTEQKNFNDIKNARNIYPKLLKIL